MAETYTQRRQSIHVICGIYANHVIGPYFFDGHVNSESYYEMLVTNIFPQLNDLGFGDEEEFHFMHDGAPAHFSNPVRQLLNDSFPNGWIGRGGTIPWPARSPDLTPLDSFLFSHLKSVVYVNRPLNLNQLKQNIINACTDITPDMLENVREEWNQRFCHCLAEEGRHFEHLL
jgi:hypothetical protein